jgi:hypothetical protein
MEARRHWRRRGAFMRSCGTRHRREASSGATPPPSAARRTPHAHAARLLAIAPHGQSDGGGRVCAPSPKLTTGQGTAPPAEHSHLVVEA